MHMVKRSSEGARRGSYGCLPGRGAPGRLKCLGCRWHLWALGAVAVSLTWDPWCGRLGVAHFLSVLSHPLPRPVSILTPFVLVEAVRGTQVPSICGQLSVIVS